MYLVAIRFLLFYIIFSYGGHVLKAQGDTYLSGILKAGKANICSFSIDESGYILFSNWISPQPCHSTLSGINDNNNLPLIYTNGCYIFDKFHIPIHSNSLLEGTDMNTFCIEHGSILKNSAQLLKSNSNDGEVLLVHAKGNYITNGIPTNNNIAFSQINLNTREIKNTQRIYESQKISEFDITTHLNGRDYWLGIVDIENSNIIITHLSDSGVVEQQDVPFEFLNLSDFCNENIQVTFSYEGNTLMVFSGKCFLALFDFDRCSGLLSNMRINLNINSNIHGKSAAFTTDDKFIYVEKEFYRIVYENRAYFSQIELYEASKVGVKITPDAVLEMPEFYSKGRMLPYNERSLIIFNQFGSKSFINIGITDNNMDTSQISRSYEKSPHYLLPAFSKKEINIDGINRCIDSVTDLSLPKTSIYPNPAQNFLKIEFPSQNYINGLEATIYGIDGNIVAYLKIESHQSSVDVSNFQAGAYILVIHNESRMYSANKINIIK